MFIVGLGVAIVWAIIYAELGSAYPYAGGDYVGVGSILGPWAGFASLALWAVTAGPVVALLAKTIATYFTDWVPSTSPALITFAVLAAAVAVALLALRTGALLHPVTLGALATALPIIAVILGTADLPAIQKSPAPFSTFFVAVAGTTAGQVLSAAVVVAMFNALIAKILFLARLYFSLGRDNIFHPTVNAVLARVHPTSGAPRAATWAVGVISAACCLLDTHLLVVFISGLTVYSLGLVSLAVLIGRRRHLTGRPGGWAPRLE